MADNPQAQQPTSGPPGGGSWRWDPITAQYTPAEPASPAPAPEPAPE